MALAAVRILFRFLRRFGLPIPRMRVGMATRICGFRVTLANEKTPQAVNA
jgi:hypothetical protein